MRIVIGLDHTRGAFCALVRALTEADAHSASLEVVSAWEPAYNVPYRDVAAFDDVRRRLAADAQRTAELLLDEARSSAAAQAVPVTIDIVEGPPLPALLEASADADLLVIGGGDDGLLRRLVHGSLITALVRKATCPVMVVPCAHAHERHLVVLPEEDVLLQGPPLSPEQLQVPTTASTSTA